jgi:hypothetical protein
VLARECALPRPPKGAIGVAAVAALAVVVPWSTRAELGEPMRHSLPTIPTRSERRSAAGLAPILRVGAETEGYRPESKGISTRTCWDLTCTNPASQAALRPIGGLADSLVVVQAVAGASPVSISRIRASFMELAAHRVLGPGAELGGIARWRYRHLRGGHLEVLVRPAHVPDAILELAGER